MDGSPRTPTSPSTLTFALKPQIPSPLDTLHPPIRSLRDTPSRFSFFTRLRKAVLSPLIFYSDQLDKFVRCYHLEMFKRILSLSFFALVGVAPDIAVILTNSLSRPLARNRN